MTPEKPSTKEQADQLVKDYAFNSSLTGFIPIPLLDSVALIATQRMMLLRMSKIYGIPFSKNLAKTLLTTLMSGIAPRVASPMLGSALKLIPGVGSVVGGATTAALGSASTYAVGKVFQNHFEAGGVLEDFDPKKVQQELLQAVEAGEKLQKEKLKVKQRK